MILPPGFVEIRVPGARAIARPDVAEWVRATLHAGGTLHGWAEERPDREALVGRGVVLAVAAPASRRADAGRWAVRHYRRGGAVARHLGDRYLRLGTPRCFREAVASCAARRRGVPTPEVLAAAAYLRGWYYRADLVTRMIESARTLADVLFGGPNGRGAPDGPGAPDSSGRRANPRARREALRAAGWLVARLEALRLVHPDLNARNILVVERGGVVRPHVLDLDRARTLPLSLPPPGPAMRRRLERSLRKLGRSAGCRLDRDEWRALRIGYEEPQ